MLDLETHRPHRPLHEGRRTGAPCPLRATQTEMMILSHPHRPHFRSATSSDLPSFPVYPSSPATQPLTGTWSFPALQAGESFFQVAMGSWPHAIAWWSRPQFVMEGETPNRVYDLPVALAAFIVATRQPARRPRLERAEARPSVCEVGRASQYVRVASVRTVEPSTCAAAGPQSRSICRWPVWPS